MAIRAEELEVLHAIVKPVAVDVVKRDRQRTASPLIQTAALTAVFPKAETKQAMLELRAAAWDSRHEELDSRCEWWSRRHEASPGCAPPRVAAETELAHAVAHAVPIVVKLLHGLPVIATLKALIDRLTQASRVIGDG